MKKSLLRFLSITLSLQLLAIGYLLAQDIKTLTPDELFNQARNIPKEKANYPKIISTLKLALEKSPDYADVRLLLGRVYTWNQNLDSARLQFNQVLAKYPENPEAHAAISDLEYWNGNYIRSLDHINQGLLYQPNSTDLLVKKARALTALKDTKQASSFFKEHSDLDTLRNFYDLLKRETAKNIASAGYEFVYFDKRFDDPWHFSYVDYSRNTKLGYVSGRLWYSRRYNTNGFQGEIDAYPILTKKLYSYIGVGASGSTIFPRFRAGTSLYYTLPKQFDSELGFRYLNFNPTETFIGVVGLGKYIKNWYINIQSYLSLSPRITSQSHTLNVRYYFSDRFNVAGLQVGTGVSPDDRARSIDQPVNLKSYKLGLNYGRDIANNLSIATAALWYYEEYAPKTWGNQISLNVSINKRF